VTDAPLAAVCQTVSAGHPNTTSKGTRTNTVHTREPGRFAPSTAIPGQSLKTAAAYQTKSAVPGSTLDGRQHKAKAASHTANPANNQSTAIVNVVRLSAQRAWSRIGKHSKSPIVPKTGKTRFIGKTPQRRTAVRPKIRSMSTAPCTILQPQDSTQAPQSHHVRNHTIATTRRLETHVPEDRRRDRLHQASVLDFAEYTISSISMRLKIELSCVSEGHFTPKQKQECLTFFQDV
jgi:hypothetical protein